MKRTFSPPPPPPRISISHAQFRGDAGLYLTWRRGVSMQRTAALLDRRRLAAFSRSCTALLHSSLPRPSQKPSNIRFLQQATPLHLGQQTSTHTHRCRPVFAACTGGASHPGTSCPANLSPPHDINPNLHLLKAISLAPTTQKLKSILDHPIL